MNLSDKIVYVSHDNEDGGGWGDLGLKAKDVKEAVKELKNELGNMIIHSEIDGVDIPFRDTTEFQEAFINIFGDKLI